MVPKPLSTSYQLLCHFEVLSFKKEIESFHNFQKMLRAVEELTSRDPSLFSQRIRLLRSQRKAYSQDIFTGLKIFANKSSLVRGKSLGKKSRTLKKIKKSQKVPKIPKTSQNLKSL